MTKRAPWSMATSVVLAGCLLLVAHAGAGQETSAAGDPVTGKWGVDGLTFLDLRFDGTKTITGSTVWRHASDYSERAAVNTGTFDPESGALRLTGEVKNRAGEVVPYVIEGKLEGDVLTGTFTVGEDKGDFRFTRLSSATSQRR